MSVRRSCLVEQTSTAGPPALALLRSRIVTSTPDVPPQTVSDVELIATELVTNAYLHGSPPLCFGLYLLADPARLRMEVTDTGSGVPRLTHPGIDAEHGRGLLLVAAMSTTWGVAKTDDGKMVWAEFVLPSAD